MNSKLEKAKRNYSSVPPQEVRPFPDNKGKESVVIIVYILKEHFKKEFEEKILRSI